MDKLQQIRDQFPITRQHFVNARGQDHPIIYLDHGASTHPPAPVLEAYTEFLERYYANIHRGNHFLSQKASELFDNVTGTVLGFVNGDASHDGVVLTTNTTTALDIASYLMQDVEGLTLVSNMEHHSNDLPHRRRGPVGRIRVDDDGTLDYGDLEERLKSSRVKLVALTGASNVTGYMPDIRLVARLAHAHGARLLVDAAQLLAHHRIDMHPSDDEGIDFIAAAGHKAYAPFGAAFLVAPMEVICNVPPYIPGGGTVKFVSETNVVWADAVERHVGGTPNIPGVIALGKSLEWLSAIGMDWIRRHELELLRSVEGRLRAIPGVAFLGEIPSDRKLGVLSFNIAGYHHEDVSSILNNEFGIATRNGCFCAHPYLSQLLGCTDAEAIRRKVANGEDVLLPGAVRATIGIFNDASDLDKLVDAVAHIASGEYRAEAHIDASQSACTEVA